jgi:O-antigen/teichoic acid export membrane protein
MTVFMIMWGSAFAIGHLYMLVRGLQELKAHVETSLWSGFRWGELKNPETGFWNFVGVVYWQTGIDLLPKHVSVLLAGNLLGPAAAGLFRLAREFSTVLTQPAVALREVLFPDLTRSFHAEDGGIHSIPFKTALIAGLAGLVIVLFSVLFGDSILGIIGTEYVPAAPLLSMLLLAATFDLASAPLRAAAYALGKAGTVLRIHVVGIVSYVALFFVMTPLTGLTGPGWAAIIASLLALGLTAKLIARMSPQLPG